MQQLFLNRSISINCLSTINESFVHVYLEIFPIIFNMLQHYQIRIKHDTVFNSHRDNLNMKTSVMLWLLSIIVGRHHIIMSKKSIELIERSIFQIHRIVQSVHLKLKVIDDFILKTFVKHSFPNRSVLITKRKRSI